MRLPDFLLRRARRLVYASASRAPDVVIGGDARPYLNRWFVIPRNRWFNVYLHRFDRSDDDRALHDHPWVNLSIVLFGSYVEHTIAAGGVHARVTRREGDMVARRSIAAHRVEIAPEARVWTLFLTGPRLREWGFHCPGGWKHWQDFTSPDGREVGAGCGEGPGPAASPHPSPLPVSRGGETANGEARS